MLSWARFLDIKLKNGSPSPIEHNSMGDPYTALLFKDGLFTSTAPEFKSDPSCKAHVFPWPGSP